MANPTVRAGDREDHRLLAAARRGRVPHRRRAVHHRADRARRRRTRARTSRGSTDFRAQLAVAPRRRGDPRRGQRRAGRAARVLRRRRGRAADAVQLHAQPAHVPRPRPRRGRADPAGAGARRRRCRRRASGRRSCATTTRSTSAGSSATSTRRCSPRSAPSRTCSSTTAASAAGWRRCSATTGAASRWPTPCSSACPARRCIRYGDEIGMGEDLSLPERNAIRTPMQWSPAPQRRLLHRDAASATCAGRSSTAASSATSRSTSTPSSATRARCSPGSSGRCSTLRECPEFGSRLVPLRRHRRPRRARARPRRAERRRCSPSPTSVRRSAPSTSAPLDEQDGDPIEVFADRDYAPVGAASTSIDVAGYGYRWIRLRRSIGARAGSARRVR